MHDHDHRHEAHAPIQDDGEGSYDEKLTWAILSLLVEKGVLSGDEVRAQVAQDALAELDLDTL